MALTARAGSNRPAHIPDSLLLAEHQIAHDFTRKPIGTPPALPADVYRDATLSTNMLAAAGRVVAVASAHVDGAP